LEIANLEDEIDSCVTGKLTSEKLDKQKESFRKHDNMELAYRTAYGVVAIEGPRFNHRDEMYRAQEDRDEMEKESIALRIKINKLEKANDRLKKRLAKSKQ